MRVSVVVINVLDECNRSSEQGITYWNLSSVWARLPHAFQLIVTSLHQLDIAKLWQMLATSWFWRLGTSSQIPADIRLLLETRFEKIHRPSSSLPPAWPGASAIQELTNRDGGFFAWETTAVDFVKWN